MKEVRKLNAEEIAVETSRLRRRLFDLRTQAVTQKVEDTSEAGKARRTLARVLTESNARARAAAAPATDSASAAASAPTAAKAKSRGKSPAPRTPRTSSTPSTSGAAGTRTAGKKA